MNLNVRTRRSKQVVAWIVVCIFLLGFFYSPVGTWTGPILGAWFVGTQRLRRGFLWMLGFAVLFGLPHLWRHLPHTGPGSLAVYACWALLALVLSVLPFTFYRMTSPHLPGFLSTLPLPLFGVAFMTIEGAFLPAGIADLRRPEDLTGFNRSGDYWKDEIGRNLRAVKPHLHRLV